MLNRYLTYTAMAKLRHLLNTNDGVVSIRITTRSDGSFNIDYLYRAFSNSDIMICNNPPVTTNLKTLRELDKSSIDFDYPSSEFKITRKQCHFS